MDDLPELPFEQILSYLSLEDRLKLRAVSRRWYQKIDNFRTKSLCYSERPSGFILEKSRLVSGPFVRNFISSPRFASFFDTFGQSILFNLKHLRLCDLRLKVENRTAFAQTLKSFGQLEELDLFGLSFRPNLKIAFKLNLPMLKSIHLEVYGIEKLTLDAPRLQRVKLVDCPFSLRLNIVHGGSVERLVTDCMGNLTVKKLKNLKYLYKKGYSRIHSTLLSDLKQLREIHLNYPDDVSELFEQMQRYGRTHLKIYLCGLFLSGPGDRSSGCCFDYLNDLAFGYLAKNRCTLADEIPFQKLLCCPSMEHVAPEVAMDVLNRLTDLKEIRVDALVRNTQRFLDLLKHFGHIAELWFRCVQPQELFDRLPEHCAVQLLTIDSAPSDVRFLFRLEHLMYLHIRCSIDVQTIRKILEELQFLSRFRINYNNKDVEIKIEHLKRFELLVAGKETDGPVDLNAAIQFIMENATEDRKVSSQSDDVLMIWYRRVVLFIFLLYLSYLFYI